MLRSEFSTPASGNGERIAGRITTQFLIAHCIALAEIGGGELIRGLILAAILDANVGHLTQQSADAEDLSGLDSVPPDELRIPISVSALARSLHMPYETTRRHVGKLIEDGACQRVSDAGVIVPASWIVTRKDVTQQLYANLQALLRRLHAAGIDVDAMAQGAAAE